MHSLVYTFNTICCSRIVGVNGSTITLNHELLKITNIETNLINKSQVPLRFFASGHAGGFECFLGCELCGRAIRVLAGFQMHDTNSTNLWYIFKNSV